MIKDSRSYETQIIDAVRSVNRALGGTYGTSSAIYKSEFNQYEVQLIDAIKSIARTISGGGLSLAGCGSADLAGYVTQKDFQSLSARVTKLEAESFFRLVDGNVTLKSGFSNLWVPGFLAAGGIGTGGGGGGASSLRLLDDVYHDTTSVLRANGDPVSPGDALVYDSTLGWVASPVSGGGGSGTVTGVKVGTTSYSPDVSGVVNLPAYPSESTVSGWGFTKNSGTITSVTLTSGTGITVSNSGTAITTSGSRTIGIASAYLTKIDHGETAYNWGNHATAGYATQTWVQNQGYALATDLASLSSRVASVENWFSVVTVDGHQTLKLNPDYAGLWATGWISAGGVGSGSGGGSVMVLNDLVDVTTSLTATGDVLTFDHGVGKWVNTPKSTYLSGYVTTTAMNTALAGKQNVIDSSHKLDYSLIDNTPTIPTVNNATLTMRLNGTNLSPTFSANASSNVTIDLGTLLTSHQTIYGLTLSAGAFTAGTYTPNSAAASFNIPTTLDHIADGSTRKYSDFVHISGAETITGAKTFSALLTVGDNITPSTDLGSTLGSSNARFAGANIVNISTRTVSFYNQSSNAKSGEINFANGWMTIKLGTDSSNKQLTWHNSYGLYPEQAGVNLGYNGANFRWANIYGVNGDFTGDLALASTGHIDIGPLRIEYDDTNKALHITKKSSSDTNTYGLYADGFVAAGGTQASS